MEETAATGTTAISEAELTRLLPTCQRCRRLRRKCDTQLPACRLCQKGKAECTFFDHALQQTLPRSYVHSLLNRLGRLRAVQITINGGTLDQSAIAPGNNYSSHVRNISSASLDLQQQQDWRARSNKVSFDKHFALEDANPTCWQFFGSSSAYSLAVEVLVAAQARFGKLTHPENYAGPEFKLNLNIPESLEHHEFRPCPPREEVEMLVNLYTRSSNVINGYSDNADIAAEIDTYLRHQGSAVKYLTGLEAHQFFRIAMICAIASSNKSRQQPHYATESFNYYVEALQCAEEVTSDISIEALQSLLLLVLYVFSYPRRGDVWKLLDYACRLSVELNIHCETGDEYEDEKSRQRRRSIFWGLYSLERTFGQHLGRPSDLPEEIITAEYPANLTAGPVDPSYTQYMLVSHYYRLIYLRSEIFRVLYLPAVAPDLPRSWYEDRFEDFHVWRNEVAHIIAAPDHILGMGTMQCEMGFNTSINFLCQPLLLRALAATKDADAIPSQSQELVIPRESYDAAVKSIEFYDRIFHAPEGTPEGDYPVTIVSAHYIHQATLTIMAHVLLALDGRLPLVTLSRDVEQFSRTVDQEGNVHVEVPPIDFSNIYDISEACLNLLNHLANRWSGMVGILDLYKEMHEKVLPALAER
ncbi:hypothetical protein PMZ80_001309 [Knufia obscura]|uniref:Zn(2)-C6 fungal-type domain-containing protein n=2 Tax=Knufia TaxID=430999 RepID=A0AAN8EQ05_9EURO|nr:hypothetical protein PMZ80_001309 [Knufia obscura]KAK5956288.1 hypothetical protein OHC33_002864 [Knufia fluminis]